MITIRQLRRTIREWIEWRATRCADRRLDRHIPGYLDRKHAIEAARRQHKASREVIAAQRAAMTEALRGMVR